MSRLPLKMGGKTDAWPRGQCVTALSWTHCIPNLVSSILPRWAGLPGALTRRERRRLFPEPIKAINAGGSGDLTTWASAL